jgi:cytochrome c2
MRLLMIFLSCAFFAACGQSGGERPAAAGAASAPATVKGLANAASFAEIADDDARAVALFEEIGKVVQHPRCVNCHPAGDRPLQGEDGALHQPLVVRGAGGMGAPGMRCTTCHGEENFANVPGHAPWSLAPASMAWEGVALGDICAQIKDTSRNGGKSLDEIVEHMASDGLVGYGWHPPAHLEPAPGDQATLGGLARAWVEAGAACPGGAQSASASAAAPAPADGAVALAAKGENVFRQCAVCHSLDPDQAMMGPTLKGVVGRPAASVEGFRYSPALRSLDVDWTEDNLRAYLENPSKFAPGTSMAIGLSNMKDFDALYAYLAEQN